MWRVIVAQGGVAFGFAALVFFLELEHQTGGTLRSALWTFFGVLLGGLPLLYQCCKHQWWQLWRFLLLGVLAGTLCALPHSDGPFGFGFLWLVFALAGFFLGALFWCVALWGNSQLTCPKSFCLPCGTAYRVARNALRRNDLIRRTGLQSK
jgi:hypothetical protein